MKTIAQSFLSVCALVFGLVMGAYLMLYKWAHAAALPHGSSGIADACEDPGSASVPKVNPNKMLFISCGGFLE
jgi:hypothetical protein